MKNFGLNLPPVSRNGFSFNILPHYEKTEVRAKFSLQKYQNKPYIRLSFSNFLSGTAGKKEKISNISSKFKFSKFITM
jgi:hypothetical protein